MVKESEKNKSQENEKPSLPKLSEELAESADRVGNILCHERLKKGLELDEISQVLCIRRIYLEAIENGSYVELPPVPYSIGFVNAYAKYLGLNNNRISQLFREELDEKPKEKSVFMVDDAGPESSLPDKRFIIGGLVALVLIALLWSFLGQTDEQTDEENVATEMSDQNIGEKIEYFSPTTEEEKNTSSDEVKVQDVSDTASEQVVIKEESFVEPAAATKVAPKPRTKIEIKVVKDDTWVEVRDDKKVYFNKVMKPGESYVVPEGDGMQLSAGKYDTVEVYADGVLVPALQPNKKMKVSLDPFMESAEH